MDLKPAVALLLCTTLRFISGSSTPFYGVTVGPLSTLHHQVSGNVYIVDEKRIRIKDFVYDGTGPAAFFWVGERGVAGPTTDQSGVLIPDENGGTDRLGRYDHADIVLTLPPALTVVNIRWLSVWCEKFAVNFGDVAFPANLQVPRATVIGQFSDEAEGVSSGNVTVVDVNNINVDAFSCSCSQSDVQIVIGVFQTSFVTLQQSDAGNLDTARTVRVNLTVPEPKSVKDFDFIGVYSSDSNVTLARIRLPPRLLVPPSLGGSSTTDYGVYVGRLPTLAHRVTGDVYVVDSKHFLIKNFVYDGTAPTAYFWVGRRGSASPAPDQATGMAVPDESESSRLTRAYDREDVIVTLPESLDVDDILWLSVWCIQFRQNFGHVTVPANVQVPGPVVIGQLSDPTHGVSSGDVTVVDSRTVVVESFTCNCAQTGIKFVGGRDMDMTSRTIKLGHPDTPYENLDSANQMNIKLTIPQSNTVHDFQLLAVRSFRHDRTLSTVALPSTLVVPPNLGRAGDGAPDGDGTPDDGVCIHHNAVFTLLATAVGLIWWWVEAIGH